MGNEVPMWLSFLACQADAPPAPADDAPSPWIVPEASEPTPTATLDDITAAVQAAIDRARTVHGTPVEASYNAAMIGASGTCPAEYSSDYGAFWYDQCTSDLGTEFNGYVFAYDAVDQFDPYSGLNLTYWTLYGAATVVDPQGLVLDLSGSAQWVIGTADDLVVWSDFVAGAFGWEGTEASGTWLDQGLDPDLYSYALLVPSVGARYIFLDGGIGEGTEAASFSALEFGDALIGASCTAEPAGAVAVRMSDGSWYDVLFDGSFDSTLPTDPADCDGCGRAFYEGERMGDVCIDPSPLLAWTEAPW
jgi:hypothetical protein